MAEKYLGQLTAKSAPATGDILVLEDSEDTKKIDYDALANAILNKLTTKTYTVAGGTNTLIAAIDALNSNSISPKTLPSTTTIEEIINPGIYWLRGSNYSDAPVSNFGFLEVNRYTSSENAVFQRFTRYDAPTESYIRVKANNAWGNWVAIPSRAEMDAVTSSMQSLTGGMAKRIAGSVASGATMTIILDSAFSVNEGFALANLNIGGNSLAGCALLYLGRGTSKVGKIFGDMPANYYSASYGSGIWTITNNSESTMFITAIVSK